MVMGWKDERGDGNGLTNTGLWAGRPEKLESVLDGNMQKAKTL